MPVAGRLLLSLPLRRRLLLLPRRLRRLRLHLPRRIIRMALWLQTTSPSLVFIRRLTIPPPLSFRLPSALLLFRHESTRRRRTLS